MQGVVISRELAKTFGCGDFVETQIENVQFEEAVKTFDLTDLVAS